MVGVGEEEVSMVVSRGVRQLRMGNRSPCILGFTRYIGKFSLVMLGIRHCDAKFTFLGKVGAAPQSASAAPPPRAGWGVLCAAGQRMWLNGHAGAGAPACSASFSALQRATCRSRMKRGSARAKPQVRSSSRRRLRACIQPSMAR
jgi:hypothetical protein